MAYSNILWQMIQRNTKHILDVLMHFLVLFVARIVWARIFIGVEHRSLYSYRAPAATFIYNQQTSETEKKRFFAFGID